MKKLTIIGDYNGIPVAVDEKGNVLMGKEPVAMSGFLDDIGGVFKDHVGGIFQKNEGSNGKLLDSNFFKTVGSAFDKNTAVGSILVPGLKNYAIQVSNKAANGTIDYSNVSFPPVVSGLPSGFTPQTPKTIVIPEENKKSMFSNPLVVIIGSGTIIALIAMMVKSSKEKNTDDHSN